MTYRRPRVPQVLAPRSLLEALDPHQGPSPLLDLPPSTPQLCLLCTTVITAAVHRHGQEVALQNRSTVLLQGEAALETGWDIVEGHAGEVMLHDTASSPRVYVCGSIADEAIVAHAHSAHWTVLRLGDPTSTSQVRAHFAKFMVKWVRFLSSRALLPA